MTNVRTSLCVSCWSELVLGLLCRASPCSYIHAVLLIKPAHRTHLQGCPFLSQVQACKITSLARYMKLYVEVTKGNKMHTYRENFKVGPRWLVWATCIFNKTGNRKHKILVIGKQDTYFVRNHFLVYICCPLRCDKSPNNPLVFLWALIVFSYCQTYFYIHMKQILFRHC
jgi:hypothetical protein